VAGKASGLKKTKWWGSGCRVRCRFAYGPADATAAPVFTFLVLTQVVPEKGLLNGCCGNCCML